MLGEVKGTSKAIGNFERLVGGLKFLQIYLSDLEKYVLESSFIYPAKCI